MKPLNGGGTRIFRFLLHDVLDRRISNASFFCDAHPLTAQPLKTGTNYIELWRNHAPYSEALIMALSSPQ